jgi:hypothetical protein
MNEPIYPQDSKVILTIPYFVNDEIFFHNNAALDQKVTATLYRDDTTPRIIEEPIRSLQNY